MPKGRKPVGSKPTKNKGPETKSQLKKLKPSDDSGTFPDTMKGILVSQLGGVDKLKLEDDCTVPSLNSDQVLIKIHASGVNPVDTYIRSGQYIALPDLPYVPGKDGAGVVTQVGEAVKKFKVGDRVYCCHSGRWGTLAQFTAANESDVFSLPLSLTFEEGAALGVPYFTAYRALFLKAATKKGERVLIHGGSGGVGLACIQMAKAYGMRVAATAGTPDGLTLIKETGADEVYNHKKSRYLEGVEKFDVILEMLANVNLQRDMDMMNSRGRIVVIGNRGDIKINPRSIMPCEASIIGCALLTSTPAEWEETAQAVGKGIKEGWIRPVIAKVYPLEKTHEAHHDIMSSGGTKGKLIISMSAE